MICASEKGDAVPVTMTGFGDFEDAGESIVPANTDAAPEPADATPPVDETATVRPDPIPDTRLYVPDHDDWNIHIKRDSERYFCYSKHPGEDWFHLLLNGEIYLTRQHEKYCLRCALRMGFLTEDRLFWQHRVPKKRNHVM